MRKQQVAIILVVIIALTSPTWSEPMGGKPDGSGGNCQYAQVVDRCGKGLFVVQAGNQAVSYTRALNDGAHASWEPRGVAYSSLPGEGGEFYSFVTQGPYLHVLYQKYYNALFKRTINIATTVGREGLMLTGVHAAPPVEDAGETIYPLYLVGTWNGAPHVVILDQEPLIATYLPNPSAALLREQRVCVDDICTGEAIDITAGSALPSGGLQQAFASVLKDVNGETVQRFYRITVQSGWTLEFAVEPWNDEGVTFAGGQPLGLGLDYESLGIEAHGVFQTSSVVTDLTFSGSSCDLLLDLTDVAIWGPDTMLGDPYVRFVSAANPYGMDALFGFPEGTCPFSEYVPLIIAPGVLVNEVGETPLALALSSKVNSPLWVYTANDSGSVDAFEVEIFRDGDTDTILPLDHFQMTLGGCPTAISFRDESYDSCMVNWEEKDGDPPPFGEICETNPDDPWCDRGRKDFGPAQ